jgi:hypothetical protein
MDSQPFDPSDDPFLGFTSELPTVPTPDSEPAFTRTQTLGEEQHSIALRNNQGPSQRVGLWFVATVSVVFGLLAGFAGGYGFAQRLIVPAAVSTSLRMSSGDSQTPRDRSTEARDRSVVAPAPTDASAVAVAVPSTQSSLIRRSTNSRRVPVTMPTMRHAGAIEVLSHPRDAHVLLDGNVVGRAPVSIPDVAEGTHEVRVELAGFNPSVTFVRVKDGSRARVGVSLEVEGLN